MQDILGALGTQPGCGSVLPRAVHDVKGSEDWTIGV